jgi:peptidoglycan/LPS O-acetylase OafA/YrhL
MSDAATSLPLAIDPRFRNRERQPGLDLLRALAIIVVVVYHAALFGFKLPGRVDRFGWIGVDLFFVLSGYLIGGQLLAPLARDQPIKLGRFFTRRALRIMPAYFVVLAIYFLLPSWREYSEMSQPLWKFLLSVQNIALHGGTAFSHAWSLAVEDQFYLALPFLLLFLFWRPRTAIIVPCLIVIGGIGLRAFLAAQTNQLMAAAYRSAAFKRGSIIQPGPGSIRSCSASRWLRSRNFDRIGGNALSIARPGFGYPR